MSKEIEKLEEGAILDLHDCVKKINELVDEINRLREIVRVLEQNHSELWKVYSL